MNGVERYVKLGVRKKEEDGTEVVILWGEFQDYERSSKVVLQELSCGMFPVM